MSDKILYTEVKAEQSFLTLINATVSHELRNPLSSLIGQIDSLKSLLTSFEQIIHLIKKNGSLKDTGLVEKLEDIHSGMAQSGKKIFSAAKFIDYFVHDILDYTILQKNSENFMKRSSVFDIRHAIDEIIEIESDKIEMKEITVTQHYSGFKNNFMVKTDTKRLQQVFLNLISNALKFTDRSGMILIIIQKFRESVRIAVADTGIGIKDED